MIKNKNLENEGTNQEGVDIEIDSHNKEEPKPSANYISFKSNVYEVLVASDNEPLNKILETAVKVKEEFWDKDQKKKENGYCG